MDLERLSASSASSSMWLLVDNPCCKELQSSAQVSPSSVRGHCMPELCAVSLTHRYMLPWAAGGSFLSHHGSEDKKMVISYVLPFSSLTVHEMVVQPRD